jgi:glutamate-1-semialdehyde aminotransferase
MGHYRKEFVNHVKSDKWWERAQKVIPGGCNTLSKQPCRFVEGVFPKFIESGIGSRIRDVDGNEYIDWIGSLGANLLGYCYPFNPRTDIGNVYSLPSCLEVELSEKLVETVPCAEMVRFGKNGVDATAGAVRLARAITGKNKVISFGYHGYQDLFNCVSPMNDGIPNTNNLHMVDVPWGDLSALWNAFSNLTHLRDGIACVIVEVPPTNQTGEEINAFLNNAIDMTHQFNALFILDEIVTGFRYSPGGAQQLYGIVPDLACIGKAMANGLPISAVVGKKEYMQHFNHVFFSTTFSGEVTAIQRSLDVIREIEEYPVINHIWRIGTDLRNGLRDLADHYGILLDLPGNPPRSLINFPDSEGKPSVLLKSLFIQECCKRGVLFGVPVFPTYSHTDEDVEITLDAAREAFKRMDEFRGRESEALEGIIMGGFSVRKG